MSPQLLAALHKAGWSQTDRRELDPAAIEAVTRRGFVVHAAAREFLLRFGRLRVVEKSPYPKPTSVMFHTCLEDVPLDNLWAADWEAACGTRVCPIGQTGYGWYTLFMDEHGRVFSDDEYGQLACWGDTAEEMLEIVLGYGGAFRPVCPEDRRPLEPPST